MKLPDGLSEFIIFSIYENMNILIWIESKKITFCHLLVLVQQNLSNSLWHFTNHQKMFSHLKTYSRMLILATPFYAKRFASMLSLDLIAMKWPGLNVFNITHILLEMLVPDARASTWLWQWLMIL